MPKWIVIFVAALMGAADASGLSPRWMEGVESAADWTARREEIKTTWSDILGRGPGLSEPKPLTVVDSAGCEGLTRYTVELEWLPGMTTRGYLLVPDGLTEPSPAVITVFYEPETAIGQGKPLRDFALQLARRGMVALSLGTTETTASKTYSLYYPTIDDAVMQPLAALALAAANARESLALDPRVDAGRICIAGHSYGGKWALFAACLYDGFACAAWGDPGIQFDEDKGGYINYWEPWYLGYYPPPWHDTWSPGGATARRGAYAALKEGGHNLDELIALMAPRPFILSGGYSDGPERREILDAIERVYDLLGAPGRIGFTSRAGHDPTPESNEAIYDFFIKHLCQ